MLEGYFGHVVFMKKLEEGFSLHRVLVLVSLWAGGGWRDGRMKGWRQQGGGKLGGEGG
jgi:hypothetical protein